MPGCIDRALALWGECESDKRCTTRNNIRARGVRDARGEPLPCCLVCSAAQRLERVMRRKLACGTTPVTIIALLSACCAYAYSQANSIEREIKIAPGVEVRVGLPQ